MHKLQGEKVKAIIHLMLDSFMTHFNQNQQTNVSFFSHFIHLLTLEELDPYQLKDELAQKLY